MRRRDIILVPFPFSDQSGQKIRPALIISNKSFNDASKDFVVCAVTSNIKAGKYSVPIDQNDIERGGIVWKEHYKIWEYIQDSEIFSNQKYSKNQKNCFSKVVDSIIELIKIEEKTIGSEGS